MIYYYIILHTTMKQYYQISLLVAAIATVGGWFYKTSSSSGRDSKASSTPSFEWNFTVNDPDLLLGVERCSIERVPEADLDPERFATEYWRVKPLIIVRETNVNQAVHRQTQKQTLLDKFHSKQVRLATYESYAFTRSETQLDLASYLANLQQVTATTSADTGFAFGADPYGLEEYYVVPQVVDALKDRLHLDWHYQTALAASGAGLAFHWHADVFAETLQGRRRWFLYPPESSPVFNPRATSAQWYHQVYRNLNATSGDSTNNANTENRSEDALLECTIGSNESIYVPADWFHSTLSLGEAVSLTTSFANTLRSDLRMEQPQVESNDNQHTASVSLDDAVRDHMLMLDAFEATDYATAIRHGRQLVTKRPNNFVPHGWVGVIQTLYAQLPGASPEQVTERLEAARQSSLQCVQLNPIYAPCRVWLFRQLKALSLIYKDEQPALAKSYQQQAVKHRQVAASLSHDKDDEILDPRWRPRSAPTSK